MNSLTPAAAATKTSTMARAPAISAAAILQLTRKLLVLGICGAAPWAAILWALGLI